MKLKKIEDLTYEELVNHYVSARKNADRYYQEVKALEEEMKRRFNQQLKSKRGM